MSHMIFDNVVADYGLGPVLTGLNLEVPAASLTTVLGTSGCGKSTLLQVAAGFLKPRSGRVVIGDVTVAGDKSWVAPEKRRVGLVPQEGALFPHLDVAGNIGFGVPRTTRKARVAEMLELIGLPDHAAAHPHELSGGMAQRVAVARALAPAPSVVLLDEPFSALDVSLRHEVRRDVLRVLQATGTTAILVTHDQEEALSLSDRVAVMRNGQIVQVDTPAKLYAQPFDRDLAEFVGDCTALPITATSTFAIHTAVGTLPANTPVDSQAGQVLIRPENLVVEPSAEGQAVVTDVAFHGHDVVIKARFADGLLVKSRMLTAEQIPPVGEMVNVRLRNQSHAEQNSRVGHILL